jgi:glycosyltransferase involved in cell wall biosynthesis
MAPRFSVLLPTHNRADVIGYAIRSVLWQTEQDFEILVVGDGCTDDTGDVVLSFADPRIRWFDLPKSPHFGYANRNIALKQAKGELIGFVAHDDILLPDHLALLADCLDRGGAEWAYSRPLWVSTDGTVVPFAVNLTDPADLAYFLNVGNSIPALCVLHRRSCFEAYGFWPEDVPQAADWRFWIRIIEGGGRARLAYCRTPTGLHFKANWRQGRTGFPAADIGVKIAKTCRSWPAPLKLDIPAGVPEQRVFFEVIAAGGPRWLETFRGAISDALDRLAWAALLSVVPPGLEQDGEIQRLSQRLQALRDSRSWRLTRPLRALKGKLRKWLA